MKKFIGIVLCLLLVIGCVMVADVERKDETRQTAIETEQIKYLEDLDFEKLYTCKQDIRKSDETIVELSQADAWLLMQVARTEGGESFDGQFWVMCVIINRMNSDKFPNTVYGVISQDNPTQFEVFKTGAYKNADINSNSHLALVGIERGFNPTEGAIWFESCSNSDESWHKSQDFVAEIAGQRYYK